MSARKSIPTGGALALLLALAASTAVLPVPVPVPHADAAANDPLLPDQWALASVGAPSAWSLATGAGVKVGIVDTGIDLTHEDLVAKVAASADCTGGGNGCATGGSAGQDDNGHGTHVAGIIAAATGNGIGMAGVAPSASLVVAKAMDPQGRGALADVDRAIRWVVDQGARVVNLSIGPELSSALGTLPGESLQPAISYAWERGAVPVIAAGNDGGELGVNYRILDAVVVGATSANGTVASYSSAIDAKYGLVAPGGDGDCRVAGAVGHCVLSAFAGNRYAVMRGTSVAAPHVAGALGLVMSQGLSRDQAVRRLLDTASRSVACGPSCAGLLDVAAAVGATRAPGSAGGAPAPSSDQPVSTPAEIRSDPAIAPPASGDAGSDGAPAASPAAPGGPGPGPASEPAAAAPPPAAATSPPVSTSTSTPAAAPAQSATRPASGAGTPGASPATTATAPTTTSPPAALSPAGPVPLSPNDSSARHAAPAAPRDVRLRIDDSDDGPGKVALGVLGLGLVVAGGRAVFAVHRRLRPPV